MIYDLPVGDGGCAEGTEWVVGARGALDDGGLKTGNWELRTGNFKLGREEMPRQGRGRMADGVMAMMMMVMFF